MLILFKIEATMLVITIAMFAMFFMAAVGCEATNEKHIKHMLQHLAKCSIFGMIVLVFMIAITAIWTFV